MGLMMVLIIAGFVGFIFLKDALLGEAAFVTPASAVFPLLF